ncbi:MAG: hypothetical protein ABR501_12345 [Pyrinomonadaceae bacterium]
MRRVSAESGCPSQLLSALITALIIGWGATRSAAQQKNPVRKSASISQSGNPASAPAPAAQLERLPPDSSVEEADVAITANVRADSLRFDVVPNPTVEFPGQPQRDTVWEAQRENVPTPVQPGVTYRNIGIRLKITSIFSDIDRIVAEALGEVPISDDQIRVSGSANIPSNNPNAKSRARPVIASTPLGGRP